MPQSSDGVSATLTPAARGESLAAFDGRGIPAGGVAPPSHTPGMLGRRALPAGRLARLGATPDFHHGLLMASDVPTASVDRSPGAAAESSAVDLALVRRAQAGDDHAFGQLIERNRRAGYRAAYAALGSAQDADDVAQDTFVAVYQKLQGFRGDASFRTWLLAIAWRKALDRRRSLSRWVRMTITHSPLDD